MLRRSMRSSKPTADLPVEIAPVKRGRHEFEEEGSRSRKKGTTQQEREAAAREREAAALALRLEREAVLRQENEEKIKRDFRQYREGESQIYINLIIIAHGDSIFNSPEENVVVKNVGPNSFAYHSRTNIKLKVADDDEVETVFKNVHSAINDHGYVRGQLEVMPRDARKEILKSKIGEDHIKRLKKYMEFLANLCKHSSSNPFTENEYSSNDLRRKDYAKIAIILNSLPIEIRKATDRENINIYRKAIQSLGVLTRLEQHVRLAYKRYPLFNKGFQIHDKDAVEGGMQWQGFYFKVNVNEEWNPHPHPFLKSKEFFSKLPYERQDYNVVYDKRDEPTDRYNIDVSVETMIDRIKALLAKKYPYIATVTNDKFTVTAVELFCDLLPLHDDLNFQTYEEREKGVAKVASEDDQPGYSGKHPGIEGYQTISKANRKLARLPGEASSSITPNPSPVGLMSRKSIAELTPAQLQERRKSVAEASSRRKTGNAYDAARDYEQYNLANRLVPEDADAALESPRKRVAFTHESAPVYKAPTKSDRNVTPRKSVGHVTPFNTPKSVLFHPGKSVGHVTPFNTPNSVLFHPGKSVQKSATKRHTLTHSELEEKRKLARANATSSMRRKSGHPSAASHGKVAGPAPQQAMGPFQNLFGEDEPKASPPKGGSRRRRRNGKKTRKNYYKQ
jgi:hypothetical protein